MENASKALLMAASVLIGILILSLAVYLFTSFATTSAEIHEDNRRQQVENFNSQFTSYVEKSDLTIYDVITLANLATENNRYYEFARRTYETKGNDYYISVRLNGNSIERGYGDNAAKLTNDYNQLIETEINQINANQTDLIQYKCNVKVSQTTGRVYLVTFTKK